MVRYYDTVCEKPAENKREAGPSENKEAKKPAYKKKGSDEEKGEEE